MAWRTTWRGRGAPAPRAWWRPLSWRLGWRADSSEESFSVRSVPVGSETMTFSPLQPDATHGLLLEKESLSPKVTRYVLSAPRIARVRRAGQFIILRLNEAGE